MKSHKYESASHWDDLLKAELAKESDRAAVILVASIFDTALNTYLRQALVPISTSNDELFDTPNAPLANFSSKIALAHRIGLLSQQFCRDLHLIRKIRNEFAHNVQGCSFEGSVVRARVLELSKSSCLADRHPKVRSNYPDGCRGDFLFVSAWMLFALNLKIEKVVALKESAKEWGYNQELGEHLLVPKRKRKRKETIKSEEA